MAILKKGDMIPMKIGGNAKIISEFGSGGQGIVYKVIFKEKEYALKWYHKGIFKGKEKEFYKNIENNIIKGAPTKSFLWPIEVTSVLNGQFGYIMDIRPSGYEKLTSFFVGSKKTKQVGFKSFEAICNAAINIIQAFRELHNGGYSYQDINDGNFFINPYNGDVLICDNDNVAPFGKNLGIMGKQRYMAPEIVQGINDPDKVSDRFSLSIILFRLLFINHPLEGAYSTPPCMTKELEKKYYGSEPIFLYDPSDKRNRPIIGTDSNLRLFWNLYPKYLREAFEYSFQKETMSKTKNRLIEREWLNHFYRLKADLVKCPACKRETIINEKGLCMECSKPLPKYNVLITKNYSIPLIPDKRIYLWHIDSSPEDLTSIIGTVITNKSNPSLVGIKNTSQMNWRVVIDSNTSKSVSPMEMMPVIKGYEIIFGNDPKINGIIK
jgi:eukaryotic-like serine/threonine-protein kinase